MNSYRLVTALIALGSVACGIGRTPLLPAGQGSGNTGGTGGTGGAGGSADAGSRGGAGNNGSGPRTFTSSEVQAALATCDLPHGPALEVDVPNDEKARLIGGWVPCPTPGMTPPPSLFSSGILLEGNGSFERLAATSDGGLAPTTGVRNQGQWSASCAAGSNFKPSDSCIYPAPNGVLVNMQVLAGDESMLGCFVGPMTFETSPTRIYVINHPDWYCDVSYSGGEIDFWMVPIP